MKKSKENGVTLVALVVTIICLLILAGVSIVLAARPDGIIDKAKESTEKHKQGAANEQESLKNIYEWSLEHETN